MNLPGGRCYTHTVESEDLLAAAGRGDEGALRELYNRHAPAMWRLICRLTRDRGVAEEILQESWLAVWRSAERFRGESAVSSWLLGVARRQAHNRLRGKRPVLVALDETDEPEVGGAGVEDVVLARADRDELAGAVATLPEHLRQVLALVLVEDLPYEDVAGILDIPVGTVKSRMSACRKRLAAAMRPDSHQRSG